MKKVLILLAVGFQILVLAWMAINREWIVRYGETVYLRTAPIDPRDIFRGDFVRLNYEISQLGSRLLEEQLKTDKIKRADTLYVLLETGPEGVAKMRGVTRSKPFGGLFVRGRAKNTWSARYPSSLSMKYGIEKYFVEQGKGLEMEKRRGTRTGVQIPLDMEIAVDRSGTAILKGHRWSKLGIGVRPVRAENTADPENTRTRTFELTLQNVSEQPLTLALLPQDCSFTLESVTTAPLEVTPRRPECGDLSQATAEMITLSPEETYTVDFDFQLPRWQVEWEEERVPIGNLPWRQRFRLVYRTPPEQNLPQQAGTAALWRGELRSTAFHGRGRVD